ncbi:MAG: translocation/assembly module TamB domain-containing protein [Terriglobales bacterium]
MSALPVPRLHEPREPLEFPRRRFPKHVLRWIAAGAGILVVMIVVAIVVLLHNARFHRYMLRVAKEQASAALGARVEARDYALRWSGVSPAVDLYNVVVYGAPPYSTPPLLQVDHIGLGVRVVSLLRRTWYLNDVRIEHPVVRVTVDARGRNNLPQTKNSGQSHTSVFDLAVRHVLLDRGEVYYNDQKSVLTADLHELSFQSAFDTFQQRYSGKLGYRDGHLQFGSYNPMPHDLQAQFEATPTVLTLRRATLSSGRSHLVLDAKLENYSRPRVQGTYSAVLDTGEFRRILDNPSLPAGSVQMGGSLQFQSDPKRPALQTVTLSGNLNSAALDLDTPSLQTRISNLAAHYSLSGGNLTVPDLRARLLGGELTAAITMRDLGGAQRSHLQAKVRGLSLASLKNVANSSAAQQVALNGTLDADADAAWGKSFDDLVARADATIQGGAAPSRGGAKPLPLNGALHARYAAARNEITLANSYLRTPQTSLTLNGTVSQRSSLAVRMQAADLHELETVANAFSGPQQSALGLYGTGSFVGSVQGSTKAPQITGQWNAANLRVHGTQWRMLRTNVSLSPAEASLRNGELDAVPSGRITFNLRAGLKRWSFSESSPLEATLNASQVNVGDLAKLAGSQAPVSGELSANVSLHGSELDPAGQGTLTLIQAKIAQEPIQSVTLNFQGSGSQVDGKLAVRAPAGPLQAQISYFPKQQGYQVQLEAAAVRLDQLQAPKARNMKLAGVLSLQASGQGTFQNPQLTASLTVPQLTVQDQTITGISLKADVANHTANVALDSQVINTSIRGRGTVNLTGDYNAQVTLDTQAIPVQAILAAYAPAQAASVTGQTELHATLRGPLKNTSQIEAHVIIPTLQVNYKNAVQIGAASPVRIDFTNGVLALQRTNLRGTGTNLTLQGTVPTKSQAPASLLLEGDVDLRLAQLLSPDLTTSGQLRFNVNSFGTRANPDVQGQVQIVNASLASGDLPVGLRNGNGVLTLTRDRLEVTHFEGTMGGGTVTASGGVVYRSSLTFDLAVAARGVRVLYPEGMRETVNADLTLTGNPQAARLGGQVHLDNLSFTPDFDLSSFMNQFGGETTPSPAPSLAQNVQLEVALSSTNNINLSSRTLSLQGYANLRVTGTAAQPVILGRVNLNGGDLLNGNRYVVESGTIDFVNPVETQANVNVNVTTTIQQYNIRVQFQGPSDRLHTTYISDPSLPPSDIINLLAFGKTSEASAANPAPGNLGAESTIASQVSGQVTSRVEKIAGISHLSVDPLLGCNQQTPGACITVQQRVTGQIYVTFSTDVNAIQRETIEVQYKATPRLTLSGTRDQNGGFGFDTRITKTW